jgi:dnd system-associated protein 4
MSDGNQTTDFVEHTINWRTVGVKRERRYDDLINRLNYGNKSIFVYLKDLMVFAATLGYSKGVRKPVLGDTISIDLDTYSSDGKDGFIYLLALLETKDPMCLKDFQLHDSVRIFEEYCNSGLSIIDEWLESNPGDPTGIDTILNKVYEEITSVEAKKGVPNDQIEILL